MPGFNKRQLIHFLLVVCIGMAPLSGLHAGPVQHLQTMPADCADCAKFDTTPEQHCIGEDCLVLMHTCGAHFGIGCLPGLAVTAADPAPALKIARSDPLYRPRYPDSIFRPPIA